MTRLNKLKISAFSLLATFSISGISTLCATDIPDVETKSFDVGKGHKITKSHYFAPYIDGGDWVTQPGYGDHGAPDLSKLANESKADYINLGFIQYANSKNTDGSLKWGFAGIPTLSEDNKDNEQYQGIKNGIKKLRSENKDAIISFGGMSGVAFWNATNKTDELYKTYKKIVDGFDAKTLDFDHEDASAADQVGNRANARALKMIQDKTGVDVNLTVQVSPTGLTNIGEAVLEAYIQSGVKLSKLNLMTMCYGDKSIAPKGFRQASLDAVENTKTQLINHYKKHGVTLTDSQAYGMLGTTPSIGFESESFPIWTAEDQKVITDDAIAKKLGMVSYWAVNRDAKIGSYSTNKAIKSKYEFAKASNSFSEKVTGSEINIPSISDSEFNKFNTTGKKMEIDKQDNKSLPVKYDATVTYKRKGTVVKYENNIYKNKWWIEAGHKPDVNDIKGADSGWELISGEAKSRTPNWTKGISYPGGTIVNYKGKEYKNKWWANAGDEPTKAEQWVEVK